MRKLPRKWIVWIVMVTMCLSILQGSVWAEEITSDEVWTEEHLLEANTDEEVLEDTEEEDSDQILESNMINSEETEIECFLENSAEDIYEEYIQSDEFETEEIKNEVITEEITYVNPLYEDIITSDAPVESRSGSRRARLLYSENVSYGTKEEAVSNLRRQLKQRKESIKVNVSLTSEEDWKTAAKEIIDQAMVHTGNPTEGDYLKWQYGKWTCRSSVMVEDDNLKCSFTYTILYYTTAEQESQVDSVLESVMIELGVYNSTKSDFEKISAIYDYLCSNITYDYTNLNNSEYLLKHTAYAALINKTAVCQGYAILFYRMALSCGIDARLIAGDGGGAHAWNIIRLGGKYYNVDATWDAGNTTYRYFLKSMSNFGRHTRYDDYNTSAFHSTYPMSETDYSAEHVHNYKEVVVREADCTEDGEKVYICEICGAKSENTKIPAEGHNWSDWTTVKDATCQDTGEEKHSCKNCLTEEIREIPAKGHIAVTDKEKEATCTESGLTEGSHCIICGEILKKQEEIPAEDHNWSDWTTVKDATCQDAGEEKHSCKNCLTEEIREIPAKGHIAVTDKEKEATCTESGLTEGSHCIICGEILKEQEEIPAEGHNWSDWTSIKEATCQDEGKEKHVCTRCGIEETKILSKVAHTVVVDKGKQATCRTTGLSDGKHCSVCKKVITPQRITAKAGHKWSNWKTITKATISKAGKQGRSCLTCKTEEIKVINKLTPKLTLSVTSLILYVNQSSTKLQADFAEGDSVKSWKLDKSGIVQISGKSNGSCTIKGKKAGTVNLTVKLKSGLSKKVRITVKKKTVKTISIKLKKNKITIARGKSVSLSPVIEPRNSTEKVTYRSSNSKIASVSSKGVVKGIRKGTAKVTVKSGEKNIVCYVTVR